MQRQMRRRKRRLTTLSVRLMASLILSVTLVVTALGVLSIKEQGTLFIYADEKPVMQGNKADKKPAMTIIADGKTNAAMQTLSGATVSEDEAEPVVRIAVTEPMGWYNKTVKIKVLAEDIANTGNFIIKTVRARIGQGGGWMDITDLMSFDMNENGTVYVEVTDSKGNTYSKNARIVCFDFTKPTLNAAVNNGSLTVQASDTDSGIKTIYVNGFEFNNHNNGTITIRMEQFDTGYQYFTIQAMDNAGNMSENYRVNNPYYNPQGTSSESKYRLPDSAEATKPASSTAKVKDNIKTDNQGNTLSKNITGSNKTEEKKKALATADMQERSVEYSTVSGQGREFYTIEAKTGKVFYLIIDRNGDNEEVHFVTDITENDLLNVTENNSETLPKNTAIPETGETAIETGLPDNNNSRIKAEDDGKSTLESFFGKKQTEEETEKTVSEEQVSENKDDDSGKVDTDNAGGWKKYLFYSIVIVIVAAIALFLKKLKRNGDNDFVEEEDEDPDEDEDLPDDESEDGEDSFFDEPPEPSIEIPIYKKAKPKETANQKETEEKETGQS